MHGVCEGFYVLELMSDLQFGKRVYLTHSVGKRETWVVVEPGERH